MLKWPIAGFMLLSLSKMLEAWGDEGTTGAERLPGHLLALIVLIMAGACFIAGARRVFGRR